MNSAYNSELFQKTSLVIYNTHPINYIWPFIHFFGKHFKMGLCAKDPCPVKMASSPFDVDEEKLNLFCQENDVITLFTHSPDKSESFVTDLIQQNKDGSICSRRLLAFFPEARYCGPNGVVIGRDGSIIVADYLNSRIRKIEADGRVSTLAGSGCQGFKDGAAHEAQFNCPYGVAIGSDGCIVVADLNNHRIRRIEADGRVSTLAGSGCQGFKDGAAHEAQFYNPTGVAIGSDGCIVVADPFNHRIRRIEADGRVSTLAGSGSYGFKDGAAHEAQFNRPWDVAIDNDGCIVVVDQDNHRIRRIKADGRVSTLAGSGSKGFKDGAAHEAQFNYPVGVAISSDGCIVVADYSNYRIRRIEADGWVSTLAGGGIRLKPP